MSTCLFDMLPTKYSFLKFIYLMYMHKQDLALNNLQLLICHKIQTTKQPYLSIYLSIYLSKMLKMIKMIKKVTKGHSRS